MLRRALFFALLTFSATAFAAKNYGYLRVTAAKALIYHGASLSSAVEATATKGQVYPLMGDKLYNGFYKIEHKGHMSFIAAGAGVVLDERGTPQPTPVATKVGTREVEEDEDKEKVEEPKVSPTPQRALTPKGGLEGGKDGDGKDHDDDDGEEGKRTPTVKPTAKATEKPDHDDDDDDEGHGKRTPTVMPTKAPTPLPTRIPTAVPTQEPTEEPTERPTAIPTRIPTRIPTLEPTEEPTERPTAIPTRIPTRIPTLEPTEEPTERPTAIPTRIPTRIPTLEPTEEPTERPTAIPTRIPTAVPTPIPTRVPTERPWPTAVPTPSTGSGQAPGPSRARGRRTQAAASGGVQTGSRRSSSRVNLGSTLSFGSQVASNVHLEREPGKLNDVELHLPLGWSKHETLVQPPFKQTASTNDQRPIEFAGFTGLGLEIRQARWLRWDFDWIAYSHRTKAADLNIPAIKVNVPGAPSTALFDESEAYYRMNTHEFRVGIKASAPLGSVVEPWVSASYGAWIWSAELSDLDRAITYGEANGVAFGGSVGLGVDFHGAFGNGLGWTVTPFVEWGAPQVNPEFKDVAGLGVDWKDSFGTPVAVPARAGIQFGIGF